MMSDVTTKQVVQFLFDNAHLAAVDSAQANLREAERLVNELKGGKVPITGLNAWVYERAVIDHAKLRQLQEVLELKGL